MKNESSIETREENTAKLRANETKTNLLLWRHGCERPYTIMADDYSQLGYVAEADRFGLRLTRTLPI
jgi:hypothetical protein